MADYRDTYRLDPRPIGEGGQAQIMRATHRVTGIEVALKRRTVPGDAAEDRMRREIEVQVVAAVSD